MNTLHLKWSSPLAVLVSLALLPAALAQPSPSAVDWPQWRGPNRDGLSADTGLLRAWPEGGPRLAWSTRETGLGHGGPALAGGRIYVLGDLSDGCYMLALDRISGRRLWKTRIGEPIGNTSYPGPRATPTIDGDRLITMTQHGDVVCLGLPGGELLWQKSLLKDLGGVRPMWHFGESPLVDGDRVLCTPGGESGTLAALHKRTGEVLWRSRGLSNACAYASVVATEIGGARQYVQLTAQNVFGVEAASGVPLWQADRPGVRAIVPTPVCADSHVFVTSGYGVGCNLFRIERKDGKFSASEVYASKAIVNHHGGVIKHGNHLYGHSDSGGWTCLEFLTGKVVWQDRGIGKGSVTFADGHLYCRSEDGPVALIEATPAGYREKGRFNQPQRSGKKAWPHPVVVGGCLYLRDQDLLLCYRLKAE